MKSLFKLIPMGMALSCCISANASEKVDLTGSIDVVSQYISRGLTNSPENDQVAMQATLSLSYEKFYFFYWGSTINYSFREIQAGKSYSSDKFEHDLGIGYSFDLGDLNINVWDAFYYYTGGKNTTSNELGVTFTKPVSESDGLSIGLSTYLYDVVYMNQWDTYFQIGYTHAFNDKFSASFNTGFSYFNDEGKYEGDLFLDTQSDFAFRFSTAQLFSPS